MESEALRPRPGGLHWRASRPRRGSVELAARGTLFLDEVEDLPLALQGKLLRLLQEGEYRPVGGTRAKRADVRVVAACNEDLRAEWSRVVAFAATSAFV